MSISEYVTSRLNRDQFDHPYTEIYPNYGKYYISEYLDNLTNTENNGGSYCTYNKYDGLVDRLYDLIFESESISMGGLRSIHFQIKRVYPRETIDMAKVNDLLMEVKE